MTTYIHNYNSTLFEPLVPLLGHKCQFNNDKIIVADSLLACIAVITHDIHECRHI